MADLRRRDNRGGWRGVKDVQPHTQKLELQNGMGSLKEKKKKEEGQTKKEGQTKTGNETNTEQNQQGWSEGVVVWH